MTEERTEAADGPICPECGEPAKVVDRFVLYSATGRPVLHVRTVCSAQHHFEEPLKD